MARHLTETGYETGRRAGRRTGRIVAIVLIMALTVVARWCYAIWAACCSRSYRRVCHG